MPARVKCSAIIKNGLWPSNVSSRSFGPDPAINKTTGEELFEVGIVNVPDKVTPASELS